MCMLFLYLSQTYKNDSITNRKYMIYIYEIEIKLNVMKEKIKRHSNEKKVSV